LAHGILERKIAENALLGWKVDSAGTSGCHNGEAPDNRAIQVALKNGFDISGQISRKITVQDFNDYDLILTMDTSNYNDVLRLCTNDTQRNKVRLIMNYLYPDKNISVPDPYYNDRFDEVVTMLDQAINELIASVLEHHHV